MIRTLALLCLAAPIASAADLEVALEGATVPTRDEGFSRFDREAGAPALGARLALGLSDKLDLTLAAHHTRFGATWHTGGFDIGRAGFVGNDLALGARANLPVGSYLRLTADASGTLHHGWARFDSDPDDNERGVQVGATGLAPGFHAAVGAMVRVEESALPVDVVLFVNGGYAWTTAMNLGAFGDVAFRGATLRAGAGIRF